MSGFFIMSDTLPLITINLYILPTIDFFRLFQVGNTLDRQSSNELGISPVHWSVLGALSRPHAKIGMSFSDLTEYLGVSRQSLDGVLKRLERDGWVERIINENDRRAKNVALTAEGFKIWDKLQINFLIFMDKRWAKLLLTMSSH